MTDKHIIVLKDYNMETHRSEETGETIRTGQIAQSMTLENFVSLLDDYLNRGGKGYRRTGTTELILAHLGIGCSRKSWPCSRWEWRRGGSGGGRS